MFLRKLSKKLVRYENSDSVGSKFRAKRIEPLLSMFSGIYEKHGCVNIVDMGGTHTYWNIISGDVLEKYNVHITLVNLPGSVAPICDERFKYVEGDCRDLSFIEGNAFHIAHSNSVIEHVGDWEGMTKFAREVSRIAPAYFVQTPNFWFPVEPHCMTPFFHWLPRQARVFLIQKLNVGNWGRQDSVDSAVKTVDSAQLLNKSMFAELFKDASHLTEKFLLMPKSLIAVRK